jgi:hypothetical protein
MGAWVTRLAVACIVLLVPLAALPAVGAPTGQAGPGWVARVLDVGEGETAFRVNVQDPDEPTILRLQLMDKEGATLAAWETVFLARETGARVTTEAYGVGIGRETPVLWGASARTSFFGSANCASGVRQTIYSDGAREVTIDIDAACLGEGPIMQVAYIAGPVASWTEEILSSSVEVIVTTRGDDVFLAGIDAFRGGLSYEYSHPLLPAGGFVRVNDDITFLRESRHAFFASFGSWRDGTAAGSLTLTSPSGDARACPCFESPSGEQGVWTFDAAAWRGYTQEPLLAAGADVVLPASSQLHDEATDDAERARHQASFVGSS